MVLHLKANVQLPETRSKRSIWLWHRVKVGSHLGYNSSISPSCCEKLICLLPFIKATAIIFRICMAWLGSGRVLQLNTEAFHFKVILFQISEKWTFLALPSISQHYMEYSEVWRLLHAFSSPSIALRVIYILSQNPTFCGMNSVHLMEDP